jgi:hypothetical protein
VKAAQAVARVGLLVCLGAAACAAKARPAVVVTPPVSPPPPPAPPPEKVKVAVLPVEAFLHPGVADALNQRLGSAKLDAASELVKTTISMEVALMQVDCSVPNDGCYSRIAKRLEANRLLWAEIDQAAKSKKKSKKNEPLVIRVLLFDARPSKVIGRAEQTFPGTVPPGALDELLRRALAEATVGPNG